MSRPTSLSSRLTAPAFAVAGALVVAAGIFVGLPDTPLNLYDVSFSLLWGRELLQGTLPNVHLFGASTPHPAAILTGALAALSSFQRRHFRVLASNADFTMYARC